MRRSESDVSWEFRGLGWWCEGEQQVAKRGESSPTEVTKGLLRGVGDVTIETIQQRFPCGRDPIGAAAAITALERSAASQAARTNAISTSSSSESRIAIAAAGVGTCTPIITPREE